MATKTKKCRVTHRITNVQRHTLGFTIDGKNYKLPSVVKFAQQGRLGGIQVVGSHIQTLPADQGGRKQKLLDLPEKVMPNFA